MHSPQPFRLLWPGGTRPSHVGMTLDPQCVRDLELERTLAILTDHTPSRSGIREVCLTLCTDPAVIVYSLDPWEAADSREGVCDMLNRLVTAACLNQHG